MTRNSKEIRNGMLKSLLVAIAVGSLGLMGCGSDLSTSPVIGTSAQDQPGEVILPTKAPRIEAPRNFEATSLGGNAVNLTWAAPSRSGLTAVISVDGQELARVSADDGVFLDTMGKPAGDHMYQLRYVRGAQASRDVHAMVEITSTGDNDGGRTDKNPEQG